MSKRVFPRDASEGSAHKMMKKSTVQTLHDDNIFHILSFLPWKCIIATCMKVSSQWLAQSLRIPLQIQISEISVLQSLSDRREGLNLTELHIYHKLMSLQDCHNMCEIIAKNPHMHSLTKLNLDLYDIAVVPSSNKHGIGDKGCGILCKSPHLTNLTSLNMSGNLIGNDGCKYIATSVHITKLQELILKNNNFGAAGVKQLVQGMNASQLTSLNLSSTEIGSEGCQLIVSSEGMANLKYLKLSSVEAERLSFTQPLPKLETLILSDNMLKHVESNSVSNLCNLKILDLGSNNLKDDICRFIAQMNFKLRELVLADNEISHYELIFSNSGSSQVYSSLIRLELSYVPKDTFQVIARTCQQLQHLHLESIEFGGTLDTCLPKNLTVLSIVDARVDVKGCQWIAQHMTNLTELCLEENEKIGDEGCAAIANSSNMSNLTSLKLGHCFIADEGCQAIASSSFMSNLTNLELDANLLTKDSCAVINDSPHLDNLTRLNLSFNMIEDDALNVIRKFKLQEVLNDKYESDSEEESD